MDKVIIEKPEPRITTIKIENMTEEELKKVVDLFDPQRVYMIEGGK